MSPPSNRYTGKVGIYKLDVKQYVQAEGLEVAPELWSFINQEALPHTGVSVAAFWRGLAALLRDLTPRNAALLQQRQQLQAQLNAWHRTHPGTIEYGAYRTLLENIGYLAPTGPAFEIETANVDPELVIAGPQLVVPADNPRYALHAANARWGSLYDALYATEVIPVDADAPHGARYDPARGAQVIAYVRDFLDRHAPLAEGSHCDAVFYGIDDIGLAVKLRSGGITHLRDPAMFIGYHGDVEAPAALLLRHHRLHIELRIDRMHHVGRQDLAGIVDVQLESALSTIQDFAGSVAAVDADDKVGVYRTWLGLMKGTLQHSFEKDGKQIRRKLHADRRYQTAAGKALLLPGRSLLLAQHVGQHVLSDAVLFGGQPVPETFIDAAVTALLGIHDLNAASVLRNSRADSIYIVQPNLHGPAEAAFADTLFTHVENMLDLPRHTLKLGLMDEERRTSLNLAECLRAVRHRIALLNTGFLDRMGDEIHTFMEAGPVLRQTDIAAQHRLDPYERQNVETALACGLADRAQIGKGTWLQPNAMTAMLAHKEGQLRSGANTTWASSPIAATLHALNYHDIDVTQVRASLINQPRIAPATLLPSMAAASTPYSTAVIAADIDSQTHRILGYVARWIELGIGCSRIASAMGAASTEDRATLRAATQQLANWLHHRLCSKEQLQNALQNAARELAASDFALQTATRLIFTAREQPHGYTENILFAARRARKHAQENNA